MLFHRGCTLLHSHRGRPGLSFLTQPSYRRFHRPKTASPEPSQPAWTPRAFCRLHPPAPGGLSQLRVCPRAAGGLPSLARGPARWGSHRALQGPAPSLRGDPPPPRNAGQPRGHRAPSPPPRPSRSARRLSAPWPQGRQGPAPASSLPPQGSPLPGLPPRGGPSRLLTPVPFTDQPESPLRPGVSPSRSPAPCIVLMPHGHRFVPGLCF